MSAGRAFAQHAPGLPLLSTSPLFRRSALPSIRSRLLTLVLASVLPILLGHIAFVLDAGQREALHVARDAATLTRALAAALDRDLDSVATAARLAAAWPTLTPATLGQFHAQARQLLRPGFAVSNFVLYGPDGQPLLDTRHAFGSALAPSANPDSIAAVLANGNARSASLYRPEPGLPLVFSSDVPVWRGGKVAYVLSSQVRPKRIADLVGNQQLPPGWVAQVVDHRGLVVASNLGGAASAGTPVDGVLASNAASRPEGLLALPDDGSGPRRHAAWRKSPSHGWMVTVSYPDDAARELLGGALARTMAVSAGLLALGLLLAWTIGGAIARSVRDLVRPAAALGRGEPLVLPPSTIRETAAVARALQDLDTELLRYRSGLEARVADRTAEIARLKARVETVYATAPVGLCFVDPALRFVMINDYLAEINAVPAVTHLGRTLPELMGAMGTALEEPYRRVRDTGRALRDLEVAGEVPARPGSTRYWLSSYYPVFGAGGELLGINAVVLDITERKLLERQNRDNEEMFRVLFEASGDAQALLAYNANFVSANPAAAALFGCAGVDEVLMLSPASASPEFQPNGRLSSEMALDMMRRALDEGGVQYEWVHRRRDGSNFHADVRLSSVDIGGRGMMQATIRDISARVAADAALRASGAQLRQRERFIRTVTDNLPAQVSYWDADQRLRFANRPCLDWLGIADEAAALGRRAAELMPAATLAQLAPWMDAGMAGRPQNFETELHNAAGRPIHLWGSYLPDFDNDGRVRGVYVLHADVSRLKLTEGRLVQALREAEQASRAKSEFLGNMSHEIRTPMNAIMGLARLLEEAPLGPRERAHVAHIRTASAALLGILSDLLDYARSDAGQLALEHLPFQLDATLQAIAVVMAPAARAKGIETVFAVAPEAPRSLRGDPARLEQVLLNLVGNAVRCTDSGQVVLSVGLAARSPGRVRLGFAVVDTGIGIAPSEQARLFEPFVQGGDIAGRKQAGIGLGLSIARRLVALMGGTLTVDSRPGQGAAFRFEADFGELAGQAAPPAPPLAASLAGLRVLVVEDNAINQEVARYVLAHAGAEVALAADGRIALDMLAAASASASHPPFDAVLMDLQMPVMNGYEAAEAIRAMGLHRLPVIAMSANTGDEDRRRAFEAGMDDHLPKPIDVDQLVATLARLTGRGGTIQAPGAAPAPGIDLHAALPRFGGKVDALQSLLLRFLDGAHETLDALQARLREGERDAALALAHRLRGVAANLGAGALAGHTLALEAALHAHDDSAAAGQLAALRAALPPLREAAHALAPQAQAPIAAPADTGALAGLLELLHNNNMRALAVHAALAPGLGALASPAALSELAEAVGMLRFEHAATLLGALLERKGDA